MVSLWLVGQLDDYIKSYCQITCEDLVTFLEKSKSTVDEKQNASYPLNFPHYGASPLKHA